MTRIDATVDTDVLVIGGGGAACRAAIAAHDGGARTILALKGELGGSGATVAPGRGVAWQCADDCSSPVDSPDVHLANILDAGLGMADPRLARIVAYETPERTDELDRWGLAFVPDPTGRKRHFSTYSCFGDQPRAHSIMNSGHGHAGDIVVVLRRQMAQRDIRVDENVFITDLVVEDGACRGALALGPDGEVILYRAGAVVLGAGGARQLYPSAGTRRIDTTGDGYAMALRAGAQLTNMAFGQFMLNPFGGGGLQVVGSPWALVPTFRDTTGADIVTPRLPPGVTAREAFWARTLHAPFSCRDASGWLDIAVVTAVREGRGTPEGGVWVDFSDVDVAAFTPSRPMHLPRDESVVLRLPEEPMQVRSSAHAVNGGVRIDEGGASTLAGLYAAGEVAAGPHGADRLGGGMVTNCQVFGLRAGRYAAEYALAMGVGEPSATALEPALARLARFGRGAGDAEAVLRDLQEETGRSLVVARHAQGLERLLDRIAQLRDKALPDVAVDGPGALRRAIEVENSLTTAHLMATAALARTESRGSHFREDFPTRDDAQWNVNIVFQQPGEHLVQWTERPDRPTPRRA